MELKKVKPLGITLVLWKSKPYIKHLIESLKDQTFKDFDLYVYDNGSKEEVSFIKSAFPFCHSYASGHNIGFAKAHNFLIHKSDNPYILVLNQDIILDKNCLKEGVFALDSHPSFGSVGPKLLKAKFSHDGIKKTDYIDSTGLLGYKTRKFVDRDAGLYDMKVRKEKEVFGVSGALAFYRRKALNDICFNNEYFDASFVMYKEDVDLAWRLQHMDYPCLFVDKCVAWHFRSLKKEKKSSPFEICKNRQKRNSRLNRYSYANHFKMLIKNEDDIFAFFYILWFELKKFIFLCCFEPRSVLGLYDVLKELPSLLKKRNFINKHKRKNNKEMAQEFFL